MGSQQNSGAESASPLNVVRIIVLALAGGVAMFAAVALIVGPLNEAGTSRIYDVYLPVALGVAALGAWVTRVFVGIPFARKLSVQRDEALEHARAGLVPNPLASLAIAGAACFEAVGMFAGVILLLNGHWSAYAGIAFALAGILFHIPTQERIERAVQNSI